MMRHPAWPVAAAFLLGTLALSHAAGVVQEVVQAGREFSVRTLSVGPATTLRFVNRDNFPHQIHAAGPRMDYDSDLQDPGQVTELAFPHTGVFEVRCGIHPRMRLTVTVTTP